MPYRITYETMYPIAAARPGAVEMGTASEAWDAVLVLIDNGEKTTIIDPDGKMISQQELRARANKEAN